MGSTGLAPIGSLGRLGTPHLNLFPAPRLHSLASEGYVSIKMRALFDCLECGYAEWYAICVALSSSLRYLNSLAIFIVHEEKFDESL